MTVYVRQLRVAEAGSTVPVLMSGGEVARVLLVDRQRMRQPHGGERQMVSAVRQRLRRSAQQLGTGEWLEQRTGGGGAKKLQYGPTAYETGHAFPPDVVCPDNRDGDSDTLRAHRGPQSVFAHACTAHLRIPLRAVQALAVLGHRDKHIPLHDR